MKTIGAIACLAGGLLWAAKMAFDWLGLDREVNRAYPPSHATDQIEFLVPLLCIGGVIALVGRWRGALGSSPALLTAGLALFAAFHYSDAHLTGASLPFGLLFMLTGHLLMIAGALLLARRLRRAADAPRALSAAAFAIFAAALATCLTPFAYGSLSNAGDTALTVCCTIASGLGWAALGGVLLGVESRNAREGASTKGRPVA